MSVDTSEFVGCILSIRTGPLPQDGLGKAIIGTVRSIDTIEQTITLDEVMVNGNIMEDGYVVNSIYVEDLMVCGRAESYSVPKAAAFKPPGPSNSRKSREFQPVKSPEPTAKKPLQVSSFSNKKDPTPPHTPVAAPVGDSDVLDKWFEHVGLVCTPKSDSEPTPKLKKLPTPTERSALIPPNPKGSAFVKAFDMTPKDENVVSSTPYFALNPQYGGAMGIGEPPKKPSSAQLSKLLNPTPKPSDARIVYTASEVEKDYFDHSKKQQKGNDSIAFEAIVSQFAKTLAINSPGQRTGVSQLTEHATPTSTPKAKANKSDFYNLLTPHPESPITSGIIGPQPKTFTSGIIGPQPKAFTSGTIGPQPKPFVQPNVANKSPKKTSSPNPPRKFKMEQPNVHTGLSQPRSFSQLLTHGNGQISAFEMSNDQIKSEEFDFEVNLAMFDKLPVTIPVKPNTERVIKSVKRKQDGSGPQFGKGDTTYKLERTISSIMLTSGEPEKVFVTDTGVVVPAVPLQIRSKILNLAHNVGFTHERMVEIMGRAVAQIAVPMLGDPYRLSPERVDDRPSVLIFAGQHWNGAVGLCAGRILATQGIRTTVFIWNYELPLFAMELQLYKLTGQKVTTDVEDLKGLHFDLVIGAMFDHRNSNPDVGFYHKWLKGKPIVLVDPPVLPSYRLTFLDQSDRPILQTGSARLSVVVPALPLAYTTEPTVKVHLVNLGIPSDIFDSNEISYRSPFGDKLILQLFPTKQDIASAAAASYIGC